jgi:hypothetical protein
LTTLSSQLPHEVAATLQRIPEEKRQLLALRAYLRSKDTLSDRWSWTTQQIEHYEHSAEQQAVNAELEIIKSQFEKSNPGYTLYVNSQVRSLDVQITRWNENPTVMRTATQLWTAAKASCRPAEDAKSVTEQVAGFLQHWMPGTPASLAAPGLSRHGQARAFDFQILQGTRTVLSTDTSAVGQWDRSGWTQKLKSAVDAASGQFIGPLAAPREPWHYEYRP